MRPAIEDDDELNQKHFSEEILQIHESTKYIKGYKMKRKFISVVAAALAITTVLGSCGTPSAASDQGTGSTGAEDPVNSAGDGVWAGINGRDDLSDVEPADEIIFWSTREDTYEKYREEFTAQTGIKVTATYQGGYDDMVTKVMTSISSGNVPDIAQLGQRHGLAQIYDSGYLAPVENYVDKTLMDDILEGFWKRFTYKDTKVILPFQNSMPVLYYNADLFAEAGVAVPNTFDEVVAAAKTVKDKTGKFGFTTNSDTPWYVNGLLYSSGSNYVDEAGKATVNTAELKNILNLYNQMAVVDKSMAQVQHSTSQEDFAAGTVAMILSSAASYKKLTELTGDSFELKVAMFPDISGRDIPMGGNGLGLFKTTPEKLKAATMFAEFMLDAERLATNTLNSGYVPVTNAAIATETYKEYLTDPNRAVIHEQLQYLGGASVYPTDSLVWNNIQELIEVVEITENPDLDALLAEMETEVQTYLDDYNAN